VKLREYLDIVWRRKFVVLLTMLLGVLAVQFVTRPSEPNQLIHSGSLSLSADDRAVGPDNELLLLQQVAMGTNAVADRVADRLGPDYYGADVSTSDYVRAKMSVAVDATVGTMQLEVIDQPSAEAVEEVLIAYSDAVIGFGREMREGEREEELATLRNREQSILVRIEALDDELERLTALQTAEERARGADPDRVTTAQLASNLLTLTQVQEDIALLEDQSEEALIALTRIGVPEVMAESSEQSPLDTRQRLLVGAGLAAVLGIGLALALDRFDGRLFTRRENEAAFGLPVLAEIPRIRWRARRRRGLITRTHASSAIAESFRLLRSSLAHARISQMHVEGPDGASRGAVVLVTSVASQVGKTTTVANLSVAAVDAGWSVLVVGADLREPTLHEHYGVVPSVGITDAVRGLTSTGRPNLEPFVVDTGVEGVTLLAHGDSVASPSETLAQLRSLMELAREDYDLILIDSPPMLAGNDVSEMIPFVDLVLLVSRIGRTTGEEAVWAEEVAARLGAPLCGVVTVGSRSALETTRRSWLHRLIRRIQRRSPDSVRQLDALRAPGNDGVPAPSSPSSADRPLGGPVPPDESDPWGVISPARPDPSRRASHPRATPSRPRMPERPGSRSGPSSTVAKRDDEVLSYASTTMEINGPPAPLAGDDEAGANGGDAFTLVDRDDEDDGDARSERNGTGGGGSSGRPPSSMRS
jgi:Mrp family chromosome partitioning ATPase